MTIRTISRKVEFVRPFELAALDGMQPAGVYDLEIDEELLPGLSFPAHRRVEVRITVPFRTMGASGHQTVPVKMEEIEEALARDAASAQPG